MEEKEIEKGGDKLVEEDWRKEEKNWKWRKMEENGGKRNWERRKKMKDADLRKMRKTKEVDEIEIGRDNLKE